MKKLKSTRLVKYPVYTIGDLSTGIYSVAPAILLMFYMTNVLGIPVGIASLAAFIPKLVDLFSNPLMGSWSDRSSTRLGRRRPFLLFAGLAIFPTFLLIWASPFNSPLLSAIFVVVFFSICTMCYSAFLVPYCALNSELAPDYHDSTTLNSYRATYSMLGCLLAGAGAPLIVEYFGGGRHGYLAMGAAMAAIMAGSIMITFFASKEPHRVQKAIHGPKTKLWVTVKNNRPLMLLLGSYFFHVVGSSVVSAALAYLVTYVLHRNTDFLSLLFFLSFGSSVVAIPIFVQLGKKIGKFASFAVALLVAVVGLAALFSIQQATSVWVVFALIILLGMSEGGIQIYAYSMLGDCIRHGDTRVNVDTPEAVISGVFVAGEKAGFAAGALIAGGIFLIAGLVETQEGFVQQPDSAIWGIRLAVSLVPAILNVLSLAIFWFYKPFDDKIVTEVPMALHPEQTITL